MRGVVAAVLALMSLRTAGATEPLTLQDALARARAANPTLRLAAAELEAARGRRLQAGLVPANPVVSGDLSRHTAPPEENPDRGISLSQEVEVGGQRGLRIATAEHDVTRAAQTVADSRRTVEGEVRRAFAGVVAAERRRALAGDSQELAGRLADVAQHRARAGDVGELEVQLARIEAARATQAVTAAQTEQARTLARLATAIGAKSEETLTVAAETAAADEAPSMPTEDTLVARALAERPDLAAARAERSRLEAEAQLTHRRGWIPNPTFRAFYRHEQANEEIIGGEVSLPLPVWNREQGTETAVRAAARRAAAEVERLTQQVARDVHLALVRRRAAAEAWGRYQREAEPAAHAVRNLIERAYASGYVGLPEVLVQQDRLIQVRSAAISAWLDLREADADVIEALGGEVK